MSVVLKRSDPEFHLPRECRSFCCTVLYGKNVKVLRRSKKRSAKQRLREELKYT